MLINLWVKDKRTGQIHQVGTDVHDSIVFLDGEPRYYNLQNGDGTGNGDEYGFEWVEPQDIDDYVMVTPSELYLNRWLVHKDLMTILNARYPDDRREQIVQDKLKELFGDNEK